MGCSKALIIAVLGSAACLSAVANASIPVGPLTPPTSVATAVPVAKPAAVTASTPQFSCPNCASTVNSVGSTSQAPLGLTIGQTQASSTAVLNLGPGAIVPQHYVNFQAPLASYVPPVTYVTADQAAATQAAMMVSATFDGGGLLNDNGDLDKDKLGQFMIENAGISEEFEKEFYGEDSVGKVLKTESYTSPFTADAAIDKGDDT